MRKTQLLSACAATAMIVAAATPAQAQTATQTQENAAADSAQAASQATDPTAPDTNRTVAPSTPDDIIVTATRRAERLADVPIAVSAVTAEALQNSGANDIRSLNQVVPSLLVSSTGSDANTSARIRGVGTVGDNPGLESSVAVFIDGVYRSRTGVGLNDLGPIDRIEVLRGPQGTLFGRNASAGLLNIVTAQPSFTFGGEGEASYGNYNAYRFMGGITGPVSDKLALRLDGVYSKRDGFYRDVNTGYRVNDRDRYLIRGQALFEPTSDISVRIIGDYSKKDESCCAAVYATQQLAPANNGLISPANPIVPVLLSLTNSTFAGYFPSYGDAYDRRIAVTPGRSYAGTTEDWGFSGQIDWKFGKTSLTSITAYRRYTSFQAADADYGLADILYYGPDSGRKFKTFSQELRLQGTIFNDKLDWLVGGYYAHEDLTAISQLKFGAQYGAFASCRLLATVSTAIPRNPTQAGCRAGPNGVVTDTVLRGIFGPGANQAQVFINGLNLLSQVNDVGDDTANYYQTSDNFAVFTHNIFHVTSTVDLTLGVRYTDETKRFNATYRNTNTICPQVQSYLLPYVSGAVATTVPTSLTGGVIALACQGNSTAELNNLPMSDRRHEGEFTGTAVLSWKPTPDLLVYGSYSRGYKAGGFNLDRSALKSPILPFALAGGAATVRNLQFAPETVNAYEAGLKFSRQMFSLNIAAFRQEFSNFQLNTFNGTVYLVQTINGCKTNLNGADRDASATTGACAADQTTYGVLSQGVELESSIRPSRYFTVNAGLTYADTHYRDNLVGSYKGVPLDPALSLLPGDNLSNAPEVTVTTSAAWTPPIGTNGMSALFYADSRTVSDYNTGSDLAPQKEQDGFTVVNARVGLRGRDERWAVELWAQNVFDVGYTQVAFSSPFQAPAQIYSAYLAEPRTYGVTVRTRF